MTKTKKSKKKKTKKGLGKKEFYFNLISLLIMIIIGIYFGIRSFYYYGKQNQKIQEEAKTLNGTVIANNPVVKEGIGLHQDTDGYYFQGKVANNYVSLMNRIFRIIRINNNGTVKLISEDIVSQFMWGENSSYQNSNLYSWLTKTKDPNSGVFYQSISDANQYLVKTKYQEDQLSNKKVIASKKNFSDWITTLTVHDYVNAKGEESYLNNGKYFWILGHDEQENNLYVDEEGIIQLGNIEESYGIRAVLTIKKNFAITQGEGTVENPYLLDTSQSKNYINSYVVLGNDTWKVYQEEKDNLRLVLNGYLSENGQEKFLSYSNTTSLYDISNRKNISYYLNQSFYSSLPYQEQLLDCEYKIGEISTDTGMNYQNIENTKITAKVGLLNIFDYNVITNLDDFYFLNNTSTIGSMEYLYRSNGLLEEEKVTEKKHIVPTICIAKNSLKSGNGSISEPFILE